MSAEEESALFQLTDDQKAVIRNNDRVARQSFLGDVPKVHSPSLKANDEFTRFADNLRDLAYA